MSSAQPSSGDDPAARVAPVRALPYPPREPEEERVRIIGTWLDNLDILNHHCFAARSASTAASARCRGRRHRRRQHLSSAHQLRDTDAEVVHLDVSGARSTSATARRDQRLDRRSAFVQACSRPAALRLGTFD